MLNAIGYGVQVGHRAYCRVATACCGHGACCDTLLMAISGLTKVYVNVDKGRCGDKAVGLDYGILGGGCYALAKLGNTAVADGYIAYACVC